MNRVVFALLMGGAVLSASQGMKIYGAKCAECHGGDGKDVSVAGKPLAGAKGTLAKLSGYKNGTFGGEQKATMQASLADLSDTDLKAVADYVDTLK